MLPPRLSHGLCPEGYGDNEELVTKATRGRHSCSSCSLAVLQVMAALCWILCCICCCVACCFRQSIEATSSSHKTTYAMRPFTVPFAGRGGLHRGSLRSYPGNVGPSPRCATTAVTNVNDRKCKRVRSSRSEVFVAPGAHPEGTPLFSPTKTKGSRERERVSVPNSTVPS